MCEICDKRKTLALHGLEAKKLASQIEATQMNFIVACSSKNRAAQDSARAEYHRLLDSLLDLHAVTAELGNDIALATINAIFGDDDDLSDHMSRGGHPLN